jgi:hypothetical protein
MFTRTQLLIAIAAGVGGVAPNLVHLGHTFLNESPNVPGFLYYIGVGIFFVLGAVVALIFSETDFRKAFFLGVSLPAFIAAAQTQSQIRTQSPGARPASAFSKLIAGAHAQQPDPRTLLAPKTASSGAAQNIVIKPVSDCVRCDLWFFDAKGKVLERKAVKATLQDTTVAVPEGATTFGIWNETINPAVVPLSKSPVTVQTYELKVKRNAWNDLKRGLGDYDTRSNDAELKLSTAPRK